MTDQHTFSDEILNAYIDGELDDADARRLLEELQHDHALSERLAHLREVSDMLKMSYAGVKPPGKCELMPARWTMPHSIAAGVMLLIGIVTGWLLHQPKTDQSLFPSAIAQQPADGVWRIVMHVNTVDEYLQNALLEETENFLKTFAGNGKKVEVEIVAYGAGIALLMPERTAYAERIASLQKQYRNLTFTACKRSMKRIAEIQGDEVTLLPNTQIASSGISQILKRQQEGWHYIRL